MRKTAKVPILAWILLPLAAAAVHAAITEPTEVRLPGTQPNEVGNIETVDKCDNCHGGYNTSVEPAHVGPAA